MSYIKPRSDTFYYIEVWDKQSLRDKTISSILDESNDTPIKYYNSSQGNVKFYNNIFCALFWKNIETAEFRLKTLKRHSEYKFEIKCLSREEFISIIPESYKVKDKWELGCYQRNKDLKKLEVEYLKKICQNDINK